MINDLIIYKKIVDLQYYLYVLYVKYPKSEKLGIVIDIKKSIDIIKRHIIKAYKNKNKRLLFLYSIDEELILLIDYMGVSYKLKYISNKNYVSFNKKVTIIYNLLGGWIKTCQEQ